MSELAREILAYLQEHPDASDSLLGIASWWLLRQRIETATRDVQQALDELVHRGFVRQGTQSDGTPIYSLQASTGPGCERRSSKKDTL
jgi:hypothetical protein